MNPWATVYLCVYAGLIGLLLYLAAGYPLAIWLLARRRRFVPVPEPEWRPRVTLLVAAHGEAAALPGRITNFLTQQWPAEQLEVLVALDGPAPEMERILLEFAAQDARVRYLVLPQRGGKNAALNAAVPHARGEVLVFSDANSRFFPDCLRHLVAALGDRRVGCVVGRLQHLDRRASDTARGESTYWGYEHFLRTQEGAAGELLTANGAILAIRAADFRPLRPEIANDFAMPMEAGARGQRVLYLPAAVALERSTPRARDEFARKVRIVTRGLAGASAFLPRLAGMRCFALWSHKVLRWFLGWLWLELLVLGFFLRDQPWVGPLFQVQAAVTALGLLGMVLRRTRVLALPAYLVLVLAASLVATTRFLLGFRAATWAVTARPRSA